MARASLVNDSEYPAVEYFVPRFLETRYCPVPKGKRPEDYCRELWAMGAVEPDETIRVILDASGRSKWIKRENGR